MNYSLCDSSHYIGRLWNPRRTFSRRMILSAFLSVVMLIILIFTYIDVSYVNYDRYCLKKSKPISVDSFQILPQNVEKPFQASMEDRQLYDTLQFRAKNRSNRYYLNDFEYFQIVRDEFPKTESAAKLGHITGIAPLLPRALGHEDVLFIVMGSVKYADKARLLTKTWLQWSQGNFFIFADAANASIPLTTLPQLENKPSRDDAQHRQLIGSQWLISNKSELVKRTKWFVFADDDSWVNVPALFSYLQLFDHRMLLSIGFVWDDIWVSRWSFINGGGGIVFSQAAFMLTIPALYTKECPFQEANDVTLMHCQKQTGVTKIHSDRFFWDYVPVIPWKYHLVPVYYVGKVTFHYINNPVIAKRMTCDVAFYWKWPIKECNDVKWDEIPNLVFHQLDVAKNSNG